MADGAGVEAVIARLALRFETGIEAAELAKIAQNTHSADPRNTAKLQRIADLLRRRPEIFATLRKTGGAVRHERGEDETDDAVVKRLAAGFDAAAAISPAASVQLSSLGNEEKLSAATAEIVAWLERRGFTGTDRDILDIGCGIGRFEQALSALSHRIVGSDISPAMISIARRRCAGLGNVEFRPARGFDLADFCDASFDRVLAVDSFPYLVLAGLAEGHFVEIARVLKRPGMAALLNYSYRGSPALDRADVHNFANANGMQVLVDGEKPFRHWDGDAFLLTISGGTLRPNDGSDAEREKPLFDGMKEDKMASGSKKHIGRGSHGKGAGAGAMTDLPKDKIGENAVLSNRDKKQHTKERGLDGNRVKSEQYQDHSADRRPED